MSRWAAGRQGYQDYATAIELPASVLPDLTLNKIPGATDRSIHERPDLVTQFLQNFLRPTSN